MTPMTPPPRLRWLHVDTPSKARGLGLPVTHLEAEGVLDGFEAAGVSAAVA